MTTDLLHVLCENETDDEGAAREGTARRAYGSSCYSCNLCGELAFDIHHTVLD